MRSSLVSLFGLALLLAPDLVTSVAADQLTDCLQGSGNAGVRCMRKRGAVLEGAGGNISAVIAKTNARSRKHCDEDSARALGYQDLDDVPFRITNACTAFTIDIHGLALAGGGSLTPSEVACQSVAVRQARKVRTVVVRSVGRCVVDEYVEGACDRAARDAKIDKRRLRARGKVIKGCGNDFDVLGPFEGASLLDRIETFLDTVITRSRHFAQQVFPPNSLGATADFGPFPVGIQTFDLVDASRLNVAGDGPRPVKVEIYYPSTDAAVAGVPEEVVELLGFTIAAIPAHRDVALAPGTYPLVLFSHGNLGIRIQSFFFAGHLASHGYIVVAPDHHGNTFLDLLGSGDLDPDVSTNRPLDMSFLIDEFLTFNATPSDFFENAIDPTRIGASGHSFGGFTSLALAGGDTGAGIFTDPRVGAIFPQAPAAPFADSYFGTIPIPTMIIGGSIDGTTPFDTQQQRPYDFLPVGADPVALVEVIDGGHFSFSDFCEVPAAVLDFLGGAPEACEPRHLPWRYAQDITKYFALNFFDAALSGDAGAFSRLDPLVIEGLEDLRYERK